MAKLIFRDHSDQNQDFSGPTANFRTSTGVIFFIFQDFAGHVGTNLDVAGVGPEQFACEQ